MAGFLKGAILGLASAAVLIVLGVVLAPEVDPAQDSLPPVVGQTDVDQGQAPDGTLNETSNGTAALKAIAEVDETPLAQTPANTPVQKPQAPQALAAAKEAPTAPNVATTAPQMTVDPALPQAVQTPQRDPELEIIVAAEPKVEVAEAAPLQSNAPSEAPSQAPSEALSDADTQSAEPVDVAESAPVLETPLEQEERSIQTAEAPQDQSEAQDQSDAQAKPAPLLIKPDAQANIRPKLPPQPTVETQPDRAQSSAESEDAPPAVQSQTPAPPRATLRRPADADSFGSPVGTFNDQAKTTENRAPSVRVNRLGRDNAQASQDAQNAEDQPNALRDNATPFSASGSPLVSILLLEDDDRSQDAARLDLITDFGVALSIAIDPLSPGATERARAYHAAGADIVVLSTLPQTASPQDVEVTFAEYQTRLPMAVAMMERPAQIGQKKSSRLSRSLLQHIIAILHDGGYGIIAENKGLNTAVQLANKTGVPHVQVFHRITPEETQDRLRTIFNRSVFLASQKGAAVVLAPGDVTALTALKTWALVDRPASIQVAPISAVLLGVAPQ